jgi:phosphatidylethanolamine/phosphatidyl-N-methylethanolamine N-methyltransferase
MAEPSSENVVRTYRFYAPFYDLLFGGVLENGRVRLLEYVNRLNPESILEVGVGTGLLLSRYPKTSNVVGVDISADMLEVARTRLEKSGRLNIKLELSDAEHLNFADNSFDCVTIPYVLSVTPNPDRLVLEARRVCKKGGKVLILNHFSGSKFWWTLERLVQPIADRIGFRSTFSYKDQVLKHNWLVEEVSEVNLFGLSKFVVLKNV